MPHYEFGLTPTSNRPQENHRPAEPSWRTWHKLPIWKAIKRHRLSQEPCCRFCAMEGRTVVANHVDHITPHFGQWLLFIKYDNTQSLCSHHHKILRQQERSRQLQLPYHAEKADPIEN